jgi:hypothetical protein
MVFAFTQVTRRLVADPDADEGGVRLAMLASMGAMLFVALYEAVRHRSDRVQVRHPELPT